MSRLLAIIGRPNVGKSTLFNRLVGERRAIVEDLPGITRDRIYARCTWEDTEFELVDTGGFDPNPEDPILQVMKRQVEMALDEADAVLFLMDARTGLNPVDEDIARMLTRWEKPVFYAVNKVDSPEKEADAYEFYSLGIESLYLISASHGRGVGGLMDDVTEALDAIDPAPPLPDDLPHIAVMGRPNVGKSTLINRVLGEDRLLTSDIPGTTRDSVDTQVTTPDGRTYVLVDTAGMRRKRAIRDNVEHYSVLRSIRAMERAHVVLVLLDSRLGMEDQDARIANLAQARGRALVFLFNKWDLIQRDEKTAQMFLKSHHERYPSLAHVPVLFTSAATGRGVTKILGAVDRVKAEWEKRIGTGELNRFVEQCVTRNPPPFVRRRLGKIFYASQVEAAPPTFVLHVNRTDAFTDNYKRYLVNRLRETYQFTGSPIRLFLRGRQQKS